MIAVVVNGIVATLILAAIEALQQRPTICLLMCFTTAVAAEIVVCLVKEKTELYKARSLFGD